MDAKTIEVHRFIIPHFSGSLQGDGRLCPPDLDVLAWLVELLA